MHGRRTRTDRVGALSLLREVNDRIAELAERSDTGVSLFLCECSDPECAEAVEVTTAEYARVCADGRVLLFPGHERGGSQRLGGRNGRFAIVGREPEDVQLQLSEGRRDG